jgi:hypothetical protein
VVRNSCLGLQTKKLEVLGDGVADLREKTVKCKTCLSTFKYEVLEPKLHVGFSP